MIPTLVLLLLLALPAWAENNPNFDTLGHRAAAYNYAHKPPEPPTQTEQIVIDLIALIDEARLAMDPSKPLSEQSARQRAWRIKTDPKVYLQELGGNGAPPPAPVPGDAP